MLKNYLVYEDERNQRNHRLYERMLRRAFGGADVTVLIAHHLNFMTEGMDKPVEIPSADTLMFDHDIMTRVFGHSRAHEIMRQLATVPCDMRDDVLESHLAEMEVTA